MRLSSGTRLGHYEVRECLGKGGMGEVYRARDTKLNRDVALKVLPAAMAADAERRMRFEREAQAVGALNHPNIVTIHSVEHAEETHFITMELVEGRTLTHFVPRGGMPLDRIFEIAVPLADALAAAHSKGITHRDLKPENVMVTDEGRVKILDFGLAKLAEAPEESAGREATATATAEGKILGTVAYMSPEQAEGKQVDVRSDVFSLGILLYEMATGTTPFSGDTTISTVTAILRDTPRSLTDIRNDLPRHLSRIITHCLAKEPDRRYQSALDVRNELTELRREVASGEVEVSSPSGISPAPVGSARRSAVKRYGWIIAVVAIAALAGVAGILFRSLDDSAADAGVARAVKEGRTGPVAVLGFENLGDPADSEHLSRMLVGLITTGLADSGGIEVVSNAKVRTALKQSGASEGGFDPTLAAEAAEIAGAGTMLVGQVMQSGSRLLLTAELVDVASGNTIGSVRAEGAGKDDLFAMAGQIAADVRGRLATGRVEEGLAINLAQSLTDSPEAYRLYTEGAAAVHERRFGDAIEHLSEAIREDPTFALAYYELGMAQLWRGDRGAALRNLHNGLQHVDRLPPRWQTTYQAVIDYEAGNADKAYDALEALVEQSPAMPDPYNYLGEVMTHYSKYSDFNRAKKLFSQALDIDPTYKVVLFHLVDATLTYDGAEAARKVLAPYGDDNDPAVLQGRLALLGFEKRYDEILALKDDPRYTDVEGSEQYWYALLKTGQAQRALELSRRRIDETVGYTKGLAHCSHAGLLIGIGRFRAALENLSTGAPLFDSPVVTSLLGTMHVTQALALETLGDIDGAIEAARHGRSKDPYLPTSRFETARLLMREGRFEEADREVEGLALLVQDSIDPAVPCWVEMASAEKMRVQGDPAGALRLLLDDGSPGCAPAVGILKNTQGRFPERELLRARAAEDAGELEQALLHYRTVFEAPWGEAGLFLYNHGIQARYEMARLEQQLGRTADARKHYREFLEDWGEPDMTIPSVEDARRQLAALGG